jgi:hypothetical protein
VLSDVLGDDLLVERGDLSGDRLPAMAFPGIDRGLAAASAPLVGVGGGVVERCHERLPVVGWHEPALAAADDLGRALRVAGDHGEAAGHRFDQGEPECLRDRGQHEQVSLSGVQRLGKLVVRPPAGEEDIASVSEPSAASSSSS